MQKSEMREMNVRRFGIYSVYSVYDQPRWCDLVVFHPK